MVRISRIWLIILLTFIMGSCAIGPSLQTSGMANPRPVKEMFPLELGGVTQWVTIRTQSLFNPVILFVHGGPGAVETSLLPYYNRDLEKYFTVVTWEQRGAGKSNHRSVPDSTITIDQILTDLHDLVGYLKQRFRQEKIFLMGHSFGTLLGLMAVDQHPGDFHAYVGIGQVVDLEMNLRCSYEEISRMAHEKEDPDAISMLAKLDLSIQGIRKNDIDDLMKMRHWLARNGRLFYGKNGYYQLGLVTILSRSYSLADLVRIATGLNRSKRLLWNQGLFDIRFPELIREVRVPVFFASGAYDLMTCTSVTESYYRDLRAPLKEMRVFESSAHCPIFEEPEKFNRWIIESLLPLAPAGNGAAIVASPDAAETERQK